MSESTHSSKSVFPLTCHPYTGGEEGGRKEGEEGQYARKHLDGIETMSRF